MEGGLTDPRCGNAKRHDLPEILMTALCTFLCGGESCVDMADLAAEKEIFLREFLALKHGLPSRDTFSRLFRLPDPDAFRACFQTFVARLEPSPIRKPSNSGARPPDGMSDTSRPSSGYRGINLDSEPCGATPPTA